MHSTLTPTTPADIFLTEQQLATRHQRSAKTYRNARVKGGVASIPFFKIGRLVRYRLSDVIAWEKSHLYTSTSEGAAK